MEGVWPIIFLAVVLKIPVFFAIWLVWWAARAEPELEDASGEGGDHTFRRWRRQPTQPRGPRRGPHGGAAHARRAGDRAHAPGPGRAAKPALTPRGLRAPGQVERSRCQLGFCALLVLRGARADPYELALARRCFRDARSLRAGQPPTAAAPSAADGGE